MSKDQNKIKELEDKVTDLENQFKRAVADYRNLEKRVQDDQQAMADYARTSLIKKILPVLDSLDQAVEGANGSEAESSWLKGVLMSVKNLRQTLAEEGLSEIPADGVFDPMVHEAVDTGPGEDGKILKVILRGYTLNGRVIRPVKVVVGKKSPEHIHISEEAKKEEQTEEV